ncbi:MAG TPA: BamA/TamA family outer membrane protein [Burkholderiaceae bacterium]|nr:BamA/TamA family outer membrane protein [Burkholderiaceae bacterium]
MSGRTVRAGVALLTLAACVGATRATAEDAGAKDSGTNASGGGSSWVQRWLDPSTAPFIPVPEVDVSPVGGVTLGLIPVWLTVDGNDEIRRIIAPDIIHSQYFGWGARGRILAYPSKDSQWSIVGGGKQQVEREFDAMYVDGLTRADLWTWTVHANFDRSGTPRFYGLGNNSPLSAQTNYVDNQGHVETSIGWNINPQWQASYLLRWGFVQIGQAVLPALPSIETRFPQLPGLDREEDMHQRLALTYDTRDSTSIPRNGERITAIAGYSNSDLWGSVSYSFVGAEANVYRTVEPWLTVAAHAALRYMPSNDHAPFWALSSVGGDQSVTGERQPLRAFAQDRFIDRDSFAAGAELRTRVTQFKAYSTTVSVELAPFIDLGKVFARNSENPLLHLHNGGGMGFRAVASPFIVGYLDVGFGPEGPAVFTGINYPF